VRPGPAAQADIALVPEDGALAVDMLALTSNPDDKPSGRGNADQTPPAAPGGLTAAIVGAREISLAWQPSTDEDLLHYNVYASDRDTVAPEPRFLVGSPHQPKLVDWGLKTGTAYRYVVTARDRAGNEGPPSPQAVVAVPARPEALIRLEAEAARHEESDKTAPVLFLGEDARCSGGRYVECRVPGDDKTPLPERLKLPSGKGHLSWTFRVEKPGDYRLWLRLRSRQWSANLSFLLDGKPAGSTSARFGWWDARTQNMMWGEVDKAYTWFWTDIFAYRALDTRPLRFRLDAGEHVFTLADVAPGLDVDAVALTSDFAWIPEGLLNYF
jgi:hypothetical protein